MTVLRCLQAATALLAGAPAGLYAGQRALGWAPSAAAWFSVTEWGTVTPNHGPWYGTREGVFLVACWGCLMLVLGLTLALGPSRKGGARAAAVGAWCATLVAQAAALVLSAHGLAWLVD